MDSPDFLGGNPGFQCLKKVGRAGIMCILGGGRIGQKQKRYPGSHQILLEGTQSISALSDLVEIKPVPSYPDLQSLQDHLIVCSVFTTQWLYVDIK